MPPKVEDPKVPTSPPDADGRFTFDVARRGPPDAGANQLFRFTIEVIKVWRALPAGGTLSVVHHKGAATTLFSVLVQDQRPLNDAEKGQLTFRAEIKVNGLVPVRHDPQNYFSLHWAPTPEGTRSRPAGHLDYTPDIAAATR
jgi:hypothetical protein